MYLCKYTQVNGSTRTELQPFWILLFSFQPTIPGFIKPPSPSTNENKAWWYVTT